MPRSVGTGSDYSSRDYTRTARSENIQVNKHLLINAASKLVARQHDRPGSSWLIAFASTFLNMCFILTTATFHDMFGQSGVVWNAFALFVLLASLMGTLFSGVAYTAGRRKSRPPMTAEQFYEESVPRWKTTSAAWPNWKLPRRSRPAHNNRMLALGVAWLPLSPWFPGIQRWLWALCGSNTRPRRCQRRALTS